MGELSASSLSILNQVGTLSLNAAAQDQQQKNIGLRNEQGQLRVVTFMNRGELDLLPEEPANVQESNSLREKLLEIAEEADLKPEVMADVRRKLALPLNVGQGGYVPLLDRRVAGEVARQIMDSVAEAQLMEDNLRSFRSFAAQHGNAGDFYVRMTQDGSGLESAGKRNIFRGHRSKQENDGVRQRFFDCVSAHYKGNIPASVRAVMTKFNGWGHPLSAKRIDLICQAMDVADVLGDSAQRHGLGEADKKLIGMLVSKMRSEVRNGRNYDAKTLKAQLGIDKIPANASRDEFMVRVACAYAEKTSGLDQTLLDGLSKAGVINILKRMTGGELINFPGAVKLLMESGNGVRLPPGFLQLANDYFEKRGKNPIAKPFSPSGVKRTKREAKNAIKRVMIPQIMRMFAEISDKSAKNTQWGVDLSRASGYSLFGEQKTYKGVFRKDKCDEPALDDLNTQVAQKWPQKWPKSTPEGRKRIAMLCRAFLNQSTLGLPSGSGINDGFMLSSGSVEENEKLSYSVDFTPEGGLVFKARKSLKGPRFAGFCEYPDIENHTFNTSKTFQVREVTCEFSPEDVNAILSVKQSDWDAMITLAKDIEEAHYKEVEEEKSNPISLDVSYNQKAPQFIKGLRPKIDYNMIVKAEA